MKNFLITIGTLLLIIAIVFGGGYLFVTRTINTHTYRPIDAEATEADAIVFEIRPGMFASDVNRELYEHGLIRHEWIANQLVRFNSWNRIQAGEFEIHAGMSLYDMFTIFTQSQGVEQIFTYVIVPEGADLVWIAHIFADALDLDADAMIALWSDTAFLEELIDEYWFITDEVLDPVLLHPLEGYIYPIRHEIPEGMTDLAEITRVILSMTGTIIAPYRTQIEEHDMTFHEILSFASVVQGETPDPEDMATVAGVFFNRLATDHRLESCATVQYLAEERAMHVTDAMRFGIGTHFDSPYNTYLSDGIPPGAINSPERAAILATINPEVHDFFFFIGDIFNCQSGGTYFFTNYSEHHAFYLANLAPSYANNSVSVCE
ncbi:MAG: endolytic transglycosylase MltG [Turicibacter sp.]|nr:endolytic transglycosylase MltG [Turicibacter sp.]